MLTTGNPEIKQYEGIKTERLGIHRYLMNLSFGSIYKRAKHCNIIQTNNANACFPSWLVGKFLGKPVICIVHGVYGDKWFEMRGSLSGFVSKIIENIQLNRSYNKIIFFSENARREGLKIGIDKNLTEVIRPGPVKNYKFKQTKKRPYVLFVGRLSKQKGLDYLIEAAEKLPNTKFLIVGKGEEQSRLKRIASRNVRFLGYVSDNKLRKLYNEALVFCLPSIGEGFGFVLLEAMSAGCAIVSTVPMDYEGIRVGIADSEGLAKSIKYLIKNPNRAIRLGNRNRIKSKDYNWEKFINRLEHIYFEAYHKL